MNNKGQSIFSEQVMIFFVVIAALVAMTTFVQRSFEARIHDARNYMINAVISSGKCDANCLKATGGTIGYEYEPYYSQILSFSSHTESDTTSAQAGNGQIIGVIYNKTFNEGTGSISGSNQLPSECANGNSTIVNCASFQMPQIRDGG